MRLKFDTIQYDSNNFRAFIPLPGIETLFQENILNKIMCNYTGNKVQIYDKISFFFLFKQIIKIFYFIILILSNFNIFWVAESGTGFNDPTENFCSI